MLLNVYDDSFIFVEILQNVSHPSLLHTIKYCLITSPFKDASELLNYNKSEERKMEEMMEGIAATGVKAGKIAIYLFFYFSIYLSHPFLGTLHASS